ncbi:D-alanyl-D-alanine carboxypeptidase/D-alanyl-D-alanine endopeptidase [Spirosoma luteolum]
MPLFPLRLFLLLFQSAVTGPVPVPPGPRPVVAPADTVATRQLLSLVDSFQASSAVRYGTVALSVRRIRDGREVVAYNARQSMPSASTLKLITTATAMAVLGSDYSYTTTLEYDGTVKDSVLTGNLYIRGTGDPSLGSWRFPSYYELPALLKNWSAQVRAAGIRRIRGQVVGDASLFPDLTTPDTWPYGDLGNYYGASLSALNLNENLYRVFFRPGRSIGSPARLLRTDPVLPYLSLQNNVSTDAAGTGDQVVIFGAPFQNQQWLTGKVPLGEEFSVKGALPEPAYYAAYALHQQLTADRIPVETAPVAVGSGAHTSVTGAGKRTTISEHKSPPLTELVQQTNFQSINLYAEALLRTTALQLDKSVRSTEGSVDALVGYWQRKGVDLGGFRIKDGSGLSTVGALAASNMTGILSAMGRESAFTAYLNTIPVVGQTGTVRNLAKGTAAAGNIRAKSGSIEGVRAYAGYFTATNGERMSFCVLVNKFTPGQSRSVTTGLEKVFVGLVRLSGN